MTDIETAAVVALLRAGSQPPHVYAELIEECGSALKVLDEEWGANSRRPRLFDEETMQSLLARASADVARWRDQQLKPLTVLDHGYPENLREVHDRPPLLFVAGALDPGDTRSLAVIGARRASSAGRKHARAIAEHLVERGYTVVSGLAAGIDTAAHTAALAAGGRTTAVIGTGHNHSYPPENADLQRQIARHGALLSQFWPDTAPSRRTFPTRNATMSGLTLGTIVVEATERSGARTQIRHALNHGRPVFLAASLLVQPWAVDLAVRAGVHVFDAPGQIVTTVERLTSADRLVS